MFRFLLAIAVISVAYGLKITVNMRKHMLYQKPLLLH